MIQFPPSTLVNKPVPKTAFYRHLDVNARLKARFVEDIDRILWWTKLAPSTLHVEDGKTVHEITVFHVTLKCEDVPDDVFLTIDKQMPRHILFVLQFEECYRLLLNYKEWIDESKGTFRIIRSFRTAWTNSEALQLTIEGATLDKVYEAFAVEALQKKVRAEKQFNRQMRLNEEARNLKRELAMLQKEINQLTIKK